MTGMRRLDDRVPMISISHAALLLSAAYIVVTAEGLSVLFIRLLQVSLIAALVAKWMYTRLGGGTFEGQMSENRGPYRMGAPKNDWLEACMLQLTNAKCV
jgi:hypothetical protein